MFSCCENFSSKIQCKYFLQQLQNCNIFFFSVPKQNLRFMIEIVDANILQYMCEVQKYETARKMPTTQSAPSIPHYPSFPAASRRVLCVFDIPSASNTTCVSASLNCTGTILSFTTLRTLNQAMSGGVKLYETFFVELTIPEAQRRLIPFRRGAEYQRLQVPLQTLEFLNSS